VSAERRVFPSFGWGGMFCLREEEGGSFFPVPKSSLRKSSYQPETGNSIYINVKEGRKPFGSGEQVGSYFFIGKKSKISPIISPMESRRLPP